MFESQWSPPELLVGTRLLETADMEGFIAQVLSLRAQRVAPSLSELETALIQTINNGLPEGVQLRYNFLDSCRRSGTLTEIEQQEFVDLVDRIEMADAQRARALVELSHIRKLLVPALMAEMRIYRPPYA